MPDEIRVHVAVNTPRDGISLTRYVDAEPRRSRTVNAENDAAAATELLGTVADEVFAHFGFTDAFAQYVGMASVLNDNDNGADGVHVRGVRELSAMLGRLAAERDQARAALAWASEPGNWLVDITHVQADAGTYTDLSGRHGATTPLPANVLNHVSARLLDRVDDIIDAARLDDPMSQAMGVRKIVHDVIAAEAAQAIFRTRVRLRPEPGKAATAESPALFEQDRT